MIKRSLGFCFYYILKMQYIIKGVVLRKAGKNCSYSEEWNFKKYVNLQILSVSTDNNNK